MLPSIYVILARRLQQKSRLQTNEQCLVYSGVQSDRTSNHFSSFFYHTYKALQTQLFRLMQLQVTEFKYHLTSGLSNSLKKLVDGLFQPNRGEYLSKGLNLLVIP